MTLREKQSVFSLNVAKLISFAYNNGYEITLGEVYRTIEQQYLYFWGYKLSVIFGSLKLVKTKQLSKTMDSRHLKKLAIDINLFKDGNLCEKKEDFKEIADYWKLLNENNDCGYYWGWDFGHFEMN